MTRTYNYSPLRAATLFACTSLLLVCLFGIGCVNLDSDEEARAGDATVDGAIDDTVGGTFLDPTPSLPTHLVDITDAIRIKNFKLDPRLQEQRPPAGASREFSTLFSRSVADFEEVISGGPPKDGIPAVYDPSFIDVESASMWITEQEEVFVADYSEFGISEVRIYPVQILIYHEIVNDTIEGLQVIITYCPLCNTAAAFGRTIDGVPHDFGVSGRLRYSNLIMYDSVTESWWQQATGEAIVGEYVGLELASLPLLTLSWKEAKKQYPRAAVLSQETGHRRPYGRNPYAGYDTLDHPFLYNGPRIDESYSPFTRVLVLKFDDQEQGYQYPELRKSIVTHDTIAEQEIVIFWSDSSVSPLDAPQVSEGRRVGSANAFFSTLEGRELQFFARDRVIYDRETNSVWDTNGRALSGDLAGSALRIVPSIQHFWFSWSAFRTPER